MKWKEMPNVSCLIISLSRLSSNLNLFHQTYRASRDEGLEQLVHYYADGFLAIFGAEIIKYAIMHFCTLIQ